MEVKKTHSAASLTFNKETFTVYLDITHYNAFTFID